jgi:hypothetical protein
MEPTDKKPLDQVRACPAYPERSRGERSRRESSLQKAIRAAAQATGIPKWVSPHTFRHSFATQLLEADYDDGNTHYARSTEAPRLPDRAARGDSCSIHAQMILGEYRCRTLTLHRGTWVCGVAQARQLGMPHSSPMCEGVVEDGSASGRSHPLPSGRGLSNMVRQLEKGRTAMVPMIRCAHCGRLDGQERHCRQCPRCHRRR